MILLCSNGLSSLKLLQETKKHIKSVERAILVVTADNEYKEKNYHVERCKKELLNLGVDRVDCFDFDTQPAEILLSYDVVEIIGGNPYYLLNSIRCHNAKNVLQMIAEKKVLIGWSAGALVLGPTIAIIDQYSPEMNFLKLDDLSALKLTDVQVLPHYSKFLKRYDNFEEKCLEYEKENQCSVFRINDGEGVIIDDKVSVVRL